VRGYGVELYVVRQWDEYNLVIVRRRREGKYGMGLVHLVEHFSSPYWVGQWMGTHGVTVMVV